MPERKVVVVERSELHGVLEKTWSRRKARTGKIGRPWVVLYDRVTDALVVDAEVVGHHVELVCCGKLDVSIRVCEQLGQLGFFRLDLDDRLGDPGKEFSRSLRASNSARRDDLRQRVKLVHGPALCDAFRAERDIDRLSQTFHEAFDHSGDARKDSAAQDQELPVVKVLLHRLDGVHDRLGIGIEVFVHRRSDHDNQTLCGPNGARLAAGGDAPGCQRPLQHLLGACLPMGHASRADGLDRSGIRVEQRDAQPGVGQGQAKGKSDMATSPENDDVP